MFVIFVGILNLHMMYMCSFQTIVLCLCNSALFEIEGEGGRR